MISLIEYFVIIIYNQCPLKVFITLKTYLKARANFLTKQDKHYVLHTSKQYHNIKNSLKSMQSI